MNELVARAVAQAKFVWKTEDLYGRRTDGATDSFMGGPCYSPVHNSKAAILKLFLRIKRILFYRASTEV
jgi:hypothetical protein